MRHFSVVSLTAIGEKQRKLFFKGSMLIDNRTSTWPIVYELLDLLASKRQISLLNGRHLRPVKAGKKYC